jgi:Tetracyclin repressor-like, C-terminal domain
MAAKIGDRDRRRQSKIDFLSLRQRRHLPDNPARRSGRARLGAVARNRRAAFWRIPRALAAAMEAGLLARQPVEPFARLLLGAMTEAAVACASRSDVAKAGSEYSSAFKSLIEALRLR